MQPQTDSDYKKIFTELIKKQMIVLGPDITLAKVKNVQGIEVNENGEVININGDSQQILQLLINQFVELSGAIVKKTMESILATYPGVAGMAVGAVAAQPVQSMTSSVPPPTQNPVAMGANPFSDITPQRPVDSPDASQNQVPKSEMDTINKALSDLNASSFINNSSQSALENKKDNVQESNSN